LLPCAPPAGTLRIWQLFAHSRSRRSLPALDSAEFCVEKHDNTHFPTFAYYFRLGLLETRLSGHLQIWTLFRRFWFSSAMQWIFCFAPRELRRLHHTAVSGFSPGLAPSLRTSARRSATLRRDSQRSNLLSTKQVQEKNSSSRTAFGLFRRGIAIRRGTMYCS
jgi:hypothetical protein